VTLWVVRAGENLTSLPVFAQHGVVAIGWPELTRSPVTITAHSRSDWGTPKTSRGM
jgi:hypothetical protein